MGHSPHSGSRDRSDPDVAIKAKGVVAHTERNESRDRGDKGLCTAICDYKQPSEAYFTHLLCHMFLNTKLTSALNLSYDE